MLTINLLPSYLASKRVRHLTAEQQIFLRLLVNSLSGGERIKTIKHHGRICEVIRRSGPLREIQPWFESNGTPSDSDSYWVLAPGQKLGAPKSEPKVHQNVLAPPMAPSDRKPLFRWTGEPRPNGKTQPAITNFPSSAYLKRLVSKLGYDSRAAMAALPHSFMLYAKSDRRRNGQEYIAGQPVYLSASSRRTKVGGALKAEIVAKIIGRHNWTDPYPYAVVRVLCQRQRPKDVANELKIDPKNLYVYASQVRREIGLQQIGEPTK